MGILPGRCSCGSVLRRLEVRGRLPRRRSGGEPLRLYLRAQSQGSMQMPLGLWAPEAFIEAQPARIDQASALIAA